ncbi:MAG: 5-methyltetrahydropteroyltriglutamate--homocysteine S-methyltransferase [Solirubrobacterales bacterium]|nr:5-methyltetrahydropteroyltriglutamate--homocysteine S-methyltransferase [Solirubrobacterales bacterium]
MASSNIAGFPRIGRHRELKFAIEGFWRGEVSEADLLATARRIRVDNWRLMRDAGIDLVPSNDFSLYDHVLDTIALVGAVPQRYGHEGETVGLDTHFAMARGREGADREVTAMEMTKWFDTNYHYIVPELGPETRFALSTSKPFDEHAEATAELGLDTVPVLLGPVSLLLLGKPADGADDFDRLRLLEPLLVVYGEVIERLARQGATWVQLDEPCFVEDRSERALDALRLAYEELAGVRGRTRILVKTYFDHVGDAYGVLRDLPVEGIGLDLDRGRANVELIANRGGLADQWLFAGIVDGRNVWINELEHSLDLLEGLRGRCAELVVSTSCSLLHTPVDLAQEPPSQALDDELRGAMAFATQKLGEVATLARGLSGGREAIAAELDANDRALERRRVSHRAHDPAIRARVAALGPDDGRRPSAFEARRAAQDARLGLPAFPTTTLGSYPQTADIRRARIELRDGEIDEPEYERRMKAEIERVIRFQDEIGLDVLVHGEPERNDMVQYFAEQLDGYASTQNGWVQSYGSRYVRPPILYGDASRPRPMTTQWIAYAQSLTRRPVKGMLTGPQTMLQWSFVRDDQPRAETRKQLALAIRDEVADLEAEGVAVIQVDEPAIREGLPLRRERWDEYLDAAVYCFRVATAAVGDETQIQTHMCYSEFRDIMDHVSAMDADVLLIWHARSHMELLEYWRGRGYDKQIAPGVYDIHSPRVPPAAEMAEILRATEVALGRERLWVAPDCGLKTRAWPEVEGALRNMVDAARELRGELSPVS